MRRSIAPTWPLLVLCCLSPRAAIAFQVLLEVDLPSGTASAVFTDGDADGVIDFDVTVGGAFLAKGEVKQEFNPIIQSLTIAPTPPDAAAIFRNVDTASRTFRVTVTSDAFASALIAPLGWNLFYNATVDDALSGVVDVPSHSVAGRVNAGAVTLGTVTGAPIAMPDGVALESSAVDPVNGAADMTLLFSFTAGPQDEFLVPSDEGFDGTSIQFDVYNQEQRCVEKMNNDARVVSDQSTKSDFKCIKTFESADATACVDDPAETKTQKKEDKLVNDFADLCSPVPAWGVNRLACCDGGTTPGAPCGSALPCAGGGACTPGLCIAAAAEEGINVLAHDLFGASVAVQAADQQKCQWTVMKFAGKLFAERWRVVRFCKRDSFAAILNDADLVTTCLGPPQPDPKDKITKRQTMLADKIQKLCIDKGVTPVGASFPGVCTAVADDTFDDCVAQRVACRFCRSLNRADAIAPPLDCDTFDDGVGNASCP